MDFSPRVYALVRQIPPGRVVSYGGVAALLGRPRGARGVGSALSALPGDSDVPWWRVVNREGRITTSSLDHTAQEQRARLEAEGVEFTSDARIDWDRFGWDAPTHLIEP